MTDPSWDSDAALSEYNLAQARGTLAHLCEIDTRVALAEHGPCADCQRSGPRFVCGKFQVCLGCLGTRRRAQRLAEARLTPVSPTTATTNGAKSHEPG